MRVQGFIGSLAPVPDFPMTRSETIRLEILGQERSVEVTVPTGPSTLTDLLPAARSLSDDLAAAAASHARCQGKSILRPRLRGLLPPARGHQCHRGPRARRRR